MIRIDIKKQLTGADGLLDLHFTAEVQKGELITLFGPTGAGKTSVLRMLAGLVKPDQGSILVEDQVWFDQAEKIDLSPQRRDIGMVFQDYSLFPNMTIRENLSYALAKGQDEDIISHLLDIAGLSNLQDKKPLHLSGGQKQRVALARTLVRKPKLLLLDEPLSALDRAMRSRLQDYILQFHQEFGLATILVSHDLSEVIKMSKRVLVLENGSVKQDWAPENLL